MLDISKISRAIDSGLAVLTLWSVAEFRDD